jgi:hypothetical protein
MKWHSHPLPNTGYILSDALTIEKKDGTKQHFAARTSGHGDSEQRSSWQYRCRTNRAHCVLAEHARTATLPVAVAD